MRLSCILRQRCAPPYCAEALEPRLLLSSASLVKDINTAPSSGSPGVLGTVNNTVIFAEDDGVHGVELYRSDGTRSGTYMLKDITPGVVGSELYEVGKANNLLYFSADESRSLWRTDGTVHGTIKLAQFEFGPTSVVQLGNLVLFGADDAVQGKGLWRTDGTPGGTRLIKNTGSTPSEVTTFNGSVYFAATGTDEQADELWRSDGTAEGTRVFADLTPEPLISTNPGDFLVTRHALFFDDDIVSEQGEASGFPEQHLWRTDGRTITKLLTLHPEPTDPDSDLTNGINQLTPVKNGVYFIDVAGNRLWRADETSDTAHVVGVFGAPFIALNEEQEPRGDGVFLLDLKNNTYYMARGDKVTRLYHRQSETHTRAEIGFQFGNELYFAQQVPKTAQEQLWRSDGTVAGTFPLLATSAAGTGQIGELTRIGSSVYFVKTSDISNLTATTPGKPVASLWRTDGTARGTVLIKSFPGGNILETQLVADDHSVYFVAADDVTGNELWITDGTPMGTHAIRDIFPGTRGSNPRNLTDGVGGLYFSTFDGTWIRRDDGTLRRLLRGGPNKGIFFGKLADTEIIATDSALWRSDGTPGGTLRFFSRNVRFSDESISHVSIAGNRIYFQQAGDLWESDGTAEGTFKLRNSLNIDRAFDNSGALLFRSLNPATWRHELWTSDGTGHGTARIADIDVQSDFIRFNGSTYFIADKALWKTDGTRRGTAMLLPVGKPAAAHPFAIAGDSLFFITGNLTLWKSDGSSAGTTKLKTINPGSLRHPEAHFITAAGKRIFFAADDSETGLELWSSDGTSKGTGLVKDINAMSSGSLDLNYGHLVGDDFVTEIVTTDAVVIGDVLYFAANDAAHGIELWKSDGTRRGTVLVQDIHLGQSDSHSWPQGFTVQGKTLFFSAEDVLHGRELWQLPLG